ncbi:MAG: DUF423 domain-containing protein [Gammaproteobacteria bacterium]|nr:DUF423 domain-containing protein [Gammaproteobacteria bacterium]
MTPGLCLRSGLVLLLCGVILGAFGAHGLAQYLASAQLEVWQTATDYLFYHALGLLGLGIWSEPKTPHRLLKLSGLCLFVGILLFSGSLYLMLLTGVRQLAMITPVGGTLFILGWLAWLLALPAVKQEENAG